MALNRSLLPVFVAILSCIWFLLADRRDYWDTYHCRCTESKMEENWLYRRPNCSFGNDACLFHLNIDEGENMNIWKDLKVGDPVYLPMETRPYRVKCRDDRFIICTKPFNLRRTVIYFIVDLKEHRRGPDNMVFCSGYETQEQCEERLKELQEGRIEVSIRHGVPA